MEIVLRQRYLHFPVRSGAPPRRLRVAIEGGPRRRFAIEWDAQQPDFWAFMDVAEFRGQRAIITAEEESLSPAELEAIRQGDELLGAEDLYLEPYRPQFHFSTRRGWSNDPNGLVYYAGEYHLFYQHNPYGTGWGTMHWGHAISRDLVHWEEQPVALYPDELGACFSGSAVVDHHNTAGFQTGIEKPIVCIYTAAGEPFTQCLAYSNDRGRTWHKYEGNPVLGHIVGQNRDPKVLWHQPTGRWIMALYLDGHDFALFASPDLKHWEKLQDVRLEGSAECPEFFPLRSADDPTKERWIFYGANGLYLIGQFDGQRFLPESGPHRLSYGNCFYASQTFNDAPEGRRIMIAWGTMDFPGMPFNQMMTFPCELTLRETAAGLRLFVQPVPEIARLYEKTYHWAECRLPDEGNPLAALRGDFWDIEAEIVPRGARQIGFFIRGLPVCYDVGRQTLSCLGCQASLPLENEQLTLRLLVDCASLEIYAAGGRIYMPVGIIPSDELHTLELFARGGPALVRSLDVRALRSIWR